jgi:NADH-quinone oxidoreductase subunit G
VNRGDHTQISTFQDRPIEHNYAGNLADVCPVGALLSHDFRFKMRVWFLEETASVCPGCSTGCNVTIDHRDGEVHRLRPRRNVEVNKSWMCDIGRQEYREIGLDTRVTGARVKRGGPWQGLGLDAALDELAGWVREAGASSAFVATPQGTNEDLFAFRSLADLAGGGLDFRVGDPQDKVRVREDNVLLRADRNPNTQGCLDQSLGRAGVAKLLADCAAGRVKTLVLQGPELLRLPDAVDALSHVAHVAVMATHEGPELDRAHLVLPATVWAEMDGSFTNFQRRVQRIRRAVPPLGDAQPRWQMAARVIQRLGGSFPAVSAREAFALLAAAVPGYAGLTYGALGATGRVLDAPAAAAEAHA